MVAKHSAWILTAVSFLALLAGSTSSASSASVRDQQIKVAREYVAALQSKDKAKVMEFFHPSVRACVNDRTRPFFDSIVAQQLQGMPGGKPTSITVTPVTHKNSPTLWVFLPAKDFPYPAMPTYNIQVNFDSTPDGLYIDTLEVAPSGASWYLVTACPTAQGMRIVREMLDKGAQQKAKAKKLVAKMPAPLLAQVKGLLARHDRMGAIQAYQKATGADLTTAASVIDVIENPNG
jgi:hypothetical protein